MKIRTRSNSGSVLLVTLATAAIMGITLASYLDLVQAQNRSVVWSQTWNSALPAAEAGVEEALSHLNTVRDDYRGTNGWTVAGNYFLRSGNIGDGKYFVSIDNATPPNIISTGIVTVPVTGKEVQRVVRVTTIRTRSGMKGMVAKGTISMNGNTGVDSFDSDDPDLSLDGLYDAGRRNDEAFVGSVYGNVETGGGTIYGWVGTGPSGSASGNAGSFEWLASSSGIESGRYQNDLNVSFPRVKAPSGGYAPTSGTANITNYTSTTTLIRTNVYPNPVPDSGVTTTTGTMTSPTKPTGVAGTITTNWVSTNTKDTPPANGTYMPGTLREVVVTNPKSRRGTYYYFDQITGYSWTDTVYEYMLGSESFEVETIEADYVLDSGTYRFSTGLSMSGQSKMVVTGDAILVIDDDFSMSGQSQIILADGASLTIYAAGDVQLSGNGIMNRSGDATKLTLYGLDTCTSVKMTGNAAWTGVVYAPEADLQLGGGGSDGFDVVGATVSKTVKMNGHFQFHFDEKLGRVGGFTQWNVASWSEI